MNVWSEGKIGGLTIPNRFVHTAVGEGMAAENGEATPRLRDRYALLGRGGAIGLIVTGHSCVSLAGKMRAGQTGIYDDKHIKGLSRVAAAARRDGSRIFIQISHAGIGAVRAVTGRQAMGPSRFMLNGSDDNRAMTSGEIEETAQQFADAAWRAREAGFDGVQLHMAHGFLLSEFLSPHYNRREDEFGCTAENRARAPMLVIRAIREKVGPDYPVAAKMNGMDYLPGGQSLEDSITAAGIFAKAGLDCVEISGGSCLSNLPEATPFRAVDPVTLKGACFFKELAAEHRERLGVPVILIGGVRRLADADGLLDEGAADFIGVCRPLIREPDLLLRWRDGKPDHPTCVSCNNCLGISRGGLGVHCPLKL